MESSDEAQVAELLESTPMDLGGMKLSYFRRPEFSRLLSYQAAKFGTLVADQGNRIVGLVSFSWGNRLQFGKKVKALYVGDFRAQNNRKLAAKWRIFYPQLISEFEKSSSYGPAVFILTAILKQNIAAMASLVKKGARSGFYYHPLASLVMVNVFFRKPHRRSLRSSNYEVKKASEVGEGLLREFLIQANSTLFLGYDFSAASGNEWDRRLKQWNHYRWEDYLLVVKKDTASSEILSCTLPWSPGDAKRMEITEAGFAIRLLFKALRVLGLRVPVVGEQINTLYLTGLYFSKVCTREQKAEAIALLLEKLRNSQRSRNYHMVSFADSEDLRLQNLLSRYVQQTTEVELFLVSSSPTPPVSYPQPVAFEMGLV